MNNQEFLVWKAGLINLTVEQRGQLTKSMKTLGMHVEDIHVPDDWLLKGLLMALRKNGLGMETTRLLKSQAFKEYTRCAPNLIKKLSKVTNSQSAKSTLAYLCGVALIHWCKRHCVYPVKGKRSNVEITTWVAKPLTARLILMNSKNLLLALEEQFPGYMAANKLYVIINKTGQKNGRQVKRTSPGKHPMSSSNKQSGRLHRSKPSKL